MGLEILIIQHKDFLKMTLSGATNLEQSKQLLLKLASLNQSPTKRDVLIDCRAATDDLTITDITVLMRLMSDHRAAFQNRLAILTQPGPRLGLAQFIETYAQNRGFRVAAFDNFESAILWLVTIIDATPEDN